MPHARRPASRVLPPKRESKFYAASGKCDILLRSPSPISVFSLSSPSDASPDISRTSRVHPTDPLHNARWLFSHPQQRSFNPYTANGGTILAIVGADFTVIAGDTRQSEGYSIQTRYAPKVFRLTDRAVLAVNGFAADGNMFVKKVKQRLEWYRHAHAKDMPLRAIARLIQTMLYAQRFFPYYVYNILGGIEEDGSGAVYSFDPVGSYEREACRAAGAAQSLVQPFLDNQIYFKNQTAAVGQSHPTHLPLPDVLAIVIDSFTSATERHIEVGDGLEIYVVVAKGRSPQGLDGMRGVQELSAKADSDRTFVIRRELKKD